MYLNMSAALIAVIVVALCVKLVGIWIIYHYMQKRKAANARLAQLYLDQQQHKVYDATQQIPASKG
jgi:cbb3-type cytochrome oxidase subunit 3